MALRIAVIDNDSGFIKVLDKRLDRLGWEHRTLAGPAPVDEIVAMRLSAIVIDLAILGPQAWEYLERLCTAMPSLGVVVCTGRSSVAQRVRGLRLGAGLSFLHPVGRFCFAAQWPYGRSSRSE